MVRAGIEYISPLLVALFCFLLSKFCYPFWIRWIKNFRLDSKGHVDHIIDPDTKLLKEKTPSFGGVPFLIIPFFVVPFFVQTLPSAYYAFLALVIGMAVVGLIDDLYKLIPSKKGISAKGKSLGQIVAATIFLTLLFSGEHDFLLKIPFGSEINFASVGSKCCFLFFLAFILVGTSNAVNLTDGMDGLAGLLSIVSLFFLALISYFEGQVFTTCMIMAFTGALFGFYLVNKKPARIFMGDVGSLPLGGLIAGFSIYLHQELVLVFLGGMFVLETLSVILQVSYYRQTKKRIFLCAPLHHHYQFYGQKEEVIVSRFALVQILFAFGGFLLYYLARMYV